MRHLGRNLIGFHTRLRSHRHHDLSQHYRRCHPSLNLPIRLHHVGRHRLHLSGRHHRCRYQAHQVSHHRLNPRAYCLRRSDQNQVGFRSHSRCHRHRDLNQHYHLFHLSLNRPIRLHHEGIHLLRLSDRHHRYRYLIHLVWHRYLNQLEC